MSRIVILCCFRNVRPLVRIMLSILSKTDLKWKQACAVRAENHKLGLAPQKY